MTRKRIGREIITGMLGVFGILLLWRMAAPLLTRHLSRSVLTIVNCVAILSAGIFPYRILAKSNGFGSDYGFSRRNRLRQILIGIGIGSGMSVVLTVIPLCLGWKDMVYTGKTYASVYEALMGLCYFVFVVGWTEEFVFRGFLYGKLKLYCLSGFTAVLLSSLLFGLYHLNPLQVLTTGVIGAFFCLCLEKIPGCTILSLAIAHGLHDWLIRVFAGML